MGINQGPISLDQKYTQGSGHVFLTGIQALVRLPMAQIRRDRAARPQHRGLRQRATAARRSAATTSNCSPRENTSSSTTSNSSPA